MEKRTAPMLEGMAEFFERRLDLYDAHMLCEIEGAREFYKFTAECLPTVAGCHILDLGCGTGLELGEYFSLNPEARVTGIDLSQGMLDALRSKFQGRKITLICGSYFDIPFGEEVYDGAVSVESLHHFEKEEKAKLYRKLQRALKPDCAFILTDYFALTEDEETRHREDLLKLKRDEGIKDGIYHYDTPLTVGHEIEALMLGGFSSVEVLCSWGATYTLRAKK